MKGIRPLVLVMVFMLGFVLLFPAGSITVDRGLTGQAFQIKESEETNPEVRTRAWTGTDRNVLWLRSDDRYNESYY